MKPLLILSCGLILLQPLGARDGSQSVHNIVIQWNSAALEGVRDSKLSVAAVARALAIVHTCMYDARAAYDESTSSTQLAGALRRPASERTLANKEKAISYAAYRALTNVLPADTDSVYKPLMKQLGYDPNDKSNDIETPAGIGNVACAAVVEFRTTTDPISLAIWHKARTPTGHTSDQSTCRPPSRCAFPRSIRLTHHWQALTYVSSTGDFVTQMFEDAQWCFVTPFAPNSLGCAW